MIMLLEKAIYLIIFFLPLYLIRFRVLEIPTNVLEIMVGILFILWLVGGGIKRFKNLIMARPIFLIAVLLILAGITTATLFSWDLRTSAGIWKSWFVVPIMFFIIFITTINKSWQVKKTFYSLLFSGLVVCLISLVFLIQGNLDPSGRLQSFYSSPNYLAMFLSPGLIINLGLLLREKEKKRKILLLVSCFLFFVVLFFTKSFGAWVGIFVAICLGLILYFYRSQKRKFIFIIVLFFVFLTLIVGLLKIKSELGGLSFDSRLEIWDRAIRVLKMYPVLGIGPGTFQDYFSKYPAWGVPQPHNVFLAFLLQTGIIGFAGFVWVLIWFYKAGLRTLIKNYDLRITLMAIMAYILIHGLVDTTYWKNDLSMVFWLVIGLGVVVFNQKSLKN